ncbi:MAG: hypothetical protein E6X72_06070, partial [Clostridioides difficile]|nr:hypothetical protein [Clostridioides difficile]
KTAFENSSNISETTLDLASLAMGVYGVKQLVSSGANYLRMNKSYINANISEAAQNSKILKQAISNVSKNSKGITLGSNGGNAGKYVSDVKGEFDALKNIKNGTKVAGSAKAGGSGSIDDMVKACEGVAEAEINPNNLDLMKDLLKNGQKTADGKNIVNQIDDSTKVMFRMDVGDNAHSIARYGYPEPVNHINVEIQRKSASGKWGTKWDFHMILDENGNVAKSFETGVWTKK